MKNKKVINLSDTICLVYAEYLVYDAKNQSRWYEEELVGFSYKGKSKQATIERLMNEGFRRAHKVRLVYKYFKRKRIPRGLRNHRYHSPLGKIMKIRRTPFVYKAA